MGNTVSPGFLGLWVSCVDKEGSRTVEDRESSREEVSRSMSDFGCNGHEQLRDLSVEQ